MPITLPASRLKMGRPSLLLLLLSLGLTAASSPAQLYAAGSAAPAEPEYAADRILLRPKHPQSAAALSQLHQALRCQALRSFERFGRVQVVSLPKGLSLQEGLRRYQQSGLVDFAEPDYVRHLDAVLPNDPKFLDGTLWGLNNYGQSGGTPHADIDAPEAWGVLNSASNVVVAVLDSGIRYTHEDLAANMWTNPIDGSHGTNAVAGTTDPNDDNGHGTLMAGVIGAVGNNGKGICGVAWRVRLMACKCFNSSGTATDSGILSCLDYAIANGAQVISASFDSTGFSQSLSNAIVSASAAGILFVASAGNNSADIDVTPHYPACYGIDNILSVAYTTRTDALGGLSNFGATNVDLAAPGDKIYSTFSASDTYYYPPSNLSINLAGTSFAAAYVSGACALMLAKYPTEPYQLIISRLLAAVDPVPALQGKCLTGGRLNLFKALSPPLRLTCWQPGQGLVNLRVSAGPNRTCILQASSDLATWSPLSTNTTSLSGTFDFTEPELPEPAHRFYRVVSTP